MFPHLDPIPLPAPVWLFKVLEVLTTTLHFVAVQLMIGGLLLGTVWAFLGRRRGNPLMAKASDAIVQWLPVVMLFLINFGVPPLLFAQVLYGRAIYTSSVLIGTFWISVIFLLMAAYTLLYVIAGRAKKGRVWDWVALIALLIVAKIAMIYSSNMTLMIRPDVWVEMYRNDPHGFHLNSGDPTVLPRWLFMILGGVTTGGAGLMALGLLRSIHTGSARLMRTWGVRLVLAGALTQILLGIWVLAAQPSDVWKACTGSGWFIAGLVLWGLIDIGLAAAAFFAQKEPSFLAEDEAAVPHWRWPAVVGSVAFVQIAVAVLVRAEIRDLALFVHGYDVWDRQVASNWLVVGLFFLCFVGALGAVGWLGTVAMRAKGVEEKYV